MNDYTFTRNCLELDRKYLCHDCVKNSCNVVEQMAVS